MQYINLHSRYKFLKLWFNSSLIIPKLNYTRAYKEQTSSMSDPNRPWLTLAPWMTTDISTLGPNQFSGMTTPVNPETIPFSTAEWTPSEITASLDPSLGQADEGLFWLESQSSSNAHGKHSCVCLARALQQQEDVCINLHWAARGLTSIAAAEMLQCLKRGTEAFDELLDCRSHPCPAVRVDLAAHIHLRYDGLGSGGPGFEESDWRGQGAYHEAVCGEGWQGPAIAPLFSPVGPG